MKYVKPMKGGRYLYYAEPGKALVRLPTLPMNHPDFLRAYAEAASGATPVPSVRKAREGTVAALCAAYKASTDFLRLRPSTREMRARIVGKIAEKGGEALVTDLRAKHIRANLAGLSPDAANNRLKVWRSLTKFAVDREWIEEDPAIQIRKVKVDRDGHHCWTDAEIAKYRDHWSSGSKPRLAFELALWTGARRGDLVALGRQNLSGGSLTYTSKKTRVEACIPIMPEAARELAEVRGMLFLETAQGKPHSEKAFGAWFKDKCRAAGLPDHCTLHGLRKAMARILAEAGESASTIAAWGGWKTLDEVAHYTEAADRKKLTHRTDRARNLDTPTEPVSENGEKPSKINAKK